MLSSSAPQPARSQSPLSRLVVAACHQTTAGPALLALEVWTKRGCLCCHVRRGRWPQAAWAPQAGTSSQGLELNRAAEMRRNFRRLRLHEPGPQNRVARKQWIPAKAYSNLSNHCQTWGCPTLALRGPLPPLTAVQGLLPMSPSTGPFEAHFNLFVTAKETRIIGATTSRHPTRRLEFLSGLLVRTSLSVPELGTEIPSTGPPTLGARNQVQAQVHVQGAGCRWLTVGEALDLGVYAVTGHRHFIESHSKQSRLGRRSGRANPPRGNRLRLSHTIPIPRVLCMWNHNSLDGNSIVSHAFGRAQSY